MTSANIGNILEQNESLHHRFRDTEHPEHQNLNASSMPVDSLESLIGLDLFHNLDDAVECEVEAKEVKRHWGI